nr:hypothetical protein [Bartonella saheliensis]
MGFYFAVLAIQSYGEICSAMALANLFCGLLCRSWLANSRETSWLANGLGSHLNLLTGLPCCLFAFVKSRTLAGWWWGKVCG